MGASDSRTSFRCIQLNYYSDLRNPFQFIQEKESHLGHLSLCFKQKIKEYLSLSDEDLKTFDWNIGVMDREMKINRYSILHTTECGWEEDMNGQRRFQTIKQFSARWHERLKEMKGDFEIKSQGESDENKDYKRILSNLTEKANQIEVCMMFDYLCYLTLREQYHQCKLGLDLEQIPIPQLVPAPSGQVSPKPKPKPKLQSVQEYMQVLKRFHSNKIDTDRRDKLFSYIQKYDIDFAFLQQIKKEDYQKMKQREMYEIEYDKSIDNAIIYKSFYLKKYSKLVWNYTQWLKHFLEKDNPLRDTLMDESNKVKALILELGPLILFSAHFSSKEKQALNQARCLLSAIETYLHSKKGQGKIFILGVNSNYFIEEEEFSIFPNNCEESTSTKQRSYIQPQFLKADVVVKGNNERNDEVKFKNNVKDQILSNREIINGRIVDFRDLERKIKQRSRRESRQGEMEQGAERGQKELSEQEKKQLFIPNKYHPFPNFIVYSQIAL